MSRRIASQVHKQASRLLRQRYIRKEPAWFQAVLAHPPLPLPAKQPPPRTSYDLSPEGVPTAKSLKKATKFAGHPSPLPIRYLEDDLRRRFFQDHPFEAFRPASLLENDAIREEHPIRGKEWVRLRQRGRNPSPEEYVSQPSNPTVLLQIAHFSIDSAIQYALNLHEHHGLPLTNAYTAAIAQFRSLRSEHHIARTIALREAEAYGIEFGPSQVEISVAKEEKALDTWHRKAELDAGALAARKRWKTIVERNPGPWSRGQEYVRLWQEGVRPTYSPVLAGNAPTEDDIDLGEEFVPAPQDIELIDRDVTHTEDFVPVPS